VTDRGPPGSERPGGTLRVGGTVWRWEARPDPPEGDDDPPSPFLEWWEIRFRLDDDPEQEARVRAGVPDEGFSDGLLTSVLRSARTRTWRDDEGDLWSVRIEGWSARGISTEVAEGDDAARRVIFSRPETGAEVGCPAPELDSLTLEPDAGLQRLLDGARGVSPGSPR